MKNISNNNKDLVEKIFIIFPVVFYVIYLFSSAGHITGGTASGLFKGASLNNAFGNSFDGLGQSMAIGTGIGVASTVGVSFANGINPINGRPFPVRTESLNQFNSVESLIEGAGTLSKVNAGMQGFVKGDGASIFKALTQNAVGRTARGGYILQDGTILFNHFSTKTDVYTIDINKSGQVFKIRVGQ